VPQLLAPVAHLHAAWLEAHREWGPGLHEDGFGLGPDDEVDTPGGFAAWVAALNEKSDPVKNAAAGRAGATLRWIVEDDVVLGGIALRHGDDDRTLRLGHIGYGIRPSARGRGLATWALGRMLLEARALGMSRVRLVCEADNAASAITIERNGGVLERTTEVSDEASVGLRYYTVEL
jgi:predicted acetyltransferase